MTSLEEALAVGALYVFAGAAFTFFIVEKALDRREKRRWEPVNSLIHAQLRTLTAAVFRGWLEVRSDGSEGTLSDKQVLLAKTVTGIKSTIDGFFLSRFELGPAWTPLFSILKSNQQTLARLMEKVDLVVLGDAKLAGAILEAQSWYSFTLFDIADPSGAIPSGGSFNYETARVWEGLSKTQPALRLQLGVHGVLVAHLTIWDTLHDTWAT
jgi:hypothetical protein